MVSAQSVQRVVGLVIGLLHLLAAVLLIDVYVTLVLRLFPSTAPLSERYFDFVMAPVVLFFRAFVVYVPNLVYIVVVSAITVLLLKFMHLLFGALAIGRVTIPGFYPDWAEPTYKLLRALVLVFLLIAIFPRPAKEGNLGLTLSVGLGYDVDWRTAEDLLLKAAKATPGVNSQPAVFQTSFDDFGVSYLLRVCTNGPPPLGRIRTALSRNILDQFNRAGVEILTPGVAVLRSSDPAPEKGPSGGTSPPA